MAVADQQSLQSFLYKTKAIVPGNDKHQFTTLRYETIVLAVTNEPASNYKSQKFYSRIPRNVELLSNEREKMKICEFRKRIFRLKHFDRRDYCNIFSFSFSKFDIFSREKKNTKISVKTG